MTERIWRYDMNNRVMNFAAHEYIVKKKLARQDRMESIIKILAALGLVVTFVYWLLIY